MFNEKEEKRNRILMLVFCIVFFWIAYISTAKGQVELSRQKSYDNKLDKPITIVYPTDPIILGSPVNSSDTMYLSIRADSIGNGAYGITLYSYIPKNITAHKYNIVIVFNDDSYGVFRTIEPSEYEVNAYEDYHAVKYEITEKTLGMLLRKKCKKIVFVGLTEYSVLKEQDYFKDFLASYSK